MLKFFDELKRRNVVKAAISFVVLSYALLEIASLLFPIWGIDKAHIRTIFIVLAISFPLWVLFAYIYEWTPDGFRKTDNVPEAESLHETTSRKLNHYIIAGLSIVIVLLVVDRVFNVTGDMIQGKPSENIIAVLPFTHLSDDTNDELFTTGMHDDVITRLSGVKDFRIIAKSAVAQFKDFEGDLSEVGNRFNANYILQGTVRRWEKQVRITTQLTDASTNQMVWSEEFNAEMGNLFDLQSSIATKITDQLEANLSPEEKTDILAVPTKNIAAYEDYLLARHTVTKPRAGFQEYQEGLGILDRAIDADPNFVKARTLRLQIHSALYSFIRNDPEKQEETQSLKETIQSALNTIKTMAPNDADFLVEQGSYLDIVEGDKLGAMQAYEKAIEQNPSDVYSLRQLANLYTYFDNPIKGKDVLKRAFDLTQNNGFISYQLSFAYEILGEYDKMVPLLERLYEFYPNEKHYLVESKYYQFLLDGKLSSFLAFKESFEEADTEFPWDERRIKNKQTVVAMFNNEFDEYHENWIGNQASHTQDHDGWICPLVANDNLNHARVMLDKGDPNMGQQMLSDVESIVLQPINLYSVCTFDPDIYLPKLDFLKGDKEAARQKLEKVAHKVIQNKSYPTGAVERAVLVQAADLIIPEKAYYYYDLVTNNSISFITFEAICADPWTYPNLIKDPQFIKEIREDGRFVEFLESFGLLK